MINDLTLLSGADIPFIEGTITIHQPTLYEIAMLGEDRFFTGCEMLKFSKDILISEDKINLENYSDFNILMSILNDKSGSLNNSISCALMVLNLIFPQYTIQIETSKISFYEEGALLPSGSLNEDNFGAFKKIIIQMFCLEKTSSAQEYNAQGDLAKQIAEKFKKRKQQLAELKPSSHKKIAIFSRYISILTVGEHKDMNSFMRYTVYQLFDEFQRYELKVAYDTFMKVRLAGATDTKEPEDWMKDIHD